MYSHHITHNHHFIILYLQINEEGVLGLDTTLQDDQSDEVLINEDLLSDIFTGQVDSFEDDRSIEDIINQVEAELDETSSIIMMKDNGVSGKDVAVRFPEMSQGGEIQGSNPVVVINIRLRQKLSTKIIKLSNVFSVELRILTWMKIFLDYESQREQNK